MADIRRFVLALSLTTACWATEHTPACHYPDDPLWRVPVPIDVGHVQPVLVNQAVDTLLHTLVERRGERTFATPLNGGAINTLGEVPNSSWYQNRHGHVRMTPDELRRGPCRGEGPSYAAPWLVISAKHAGVTPGFVIEDSRGDRYVLKLDPLSNPEMATAAEVISSRFFYALGYNVPENYIVRFGESQLTVTPDSELVDDSGRRRRMAREDILRVLAGAPRQHGLFRAVASLYLPGRIVGPFRFFGVRQDDPNDIVPHEDRRDLRGLFVFAAWLNRNDFKANNTLDTVVEEQAVRYVRHYLIDFGSTLGSGAWAPKLPSAGHEYLFDLKPALRQMLTLGLAVPKWQLVTFPDIPAVGNFESSTFEPREWRPNYPNPAFSNKTAEDTYWAAKKVMAFTDDDIRAIVEAGEYSDRRATEYVTEVLAGRRDKIVRSFLPLVLPLDHFRILDGSLVFDDLGAPYRLAKGAVYSAALQTPRGLQHLQVRGRSVHLPPVIGLMFRAGCVTVRLWSSVARGRSVTVHLRSNRDSIRVVAVDRAGYTGAEG